MIKLNFNKIKNIRDLGGIQNKNHRTIRYGKLLRSGNLYKATEKDINKLKDKVNLGLIIDLRTKQEVYEKPDKKIKNVKYINIPVLDEEKAGITRTKQSTTLSELARNVPNMLELYKCMIQDELAIKNLRKILNEIIDFNNEKAILVHCTAGKDRTELIIYCLLQILDIDYELILQDFLQSNRVMKIKGRLLYILSFIKTHNIKVAQGVYKFCIVNERYLQTIQNSIIEKYESVDNFIINILEIDDNKRRKFKNRFLD